MTKETMTKMVLDGWNAQVQNAHKMLETVTDDQWHTEIAPGRNRGIYILGHITAVNDRMVPLLGLGEQAFPHLNDTFLSKPDKAVAEMPTIGELKNHWHQSVDTLANHFNKLTTDDWFAKHTSVSEEDFAKEPHRNRLNVVLGRASHLSYHLGQLTLLKK